MGDRPFIGFMEYFVKEKETPLRCLFFFGGDYWTRTSDLLRVKQAL